MVALLRRRSPKRLAQEGFLSRSAIVIVSTVVLFGIFSFSSQVMAEDVPIPVPTVTSSPSPIPTLPTTAAQQLTPMVQLPAPGGKTYFEPSGTVAKVAESGAVGSPATTTSTPASGTVLSPNGIPIGPQNAVDANGKVILDPNGKPVVVAPVLNAQGQPLVPVGVGGVLMQHPQLGADGKVLLGPDGKPILLNPIVGKDGKPVFDANQNPVSNQVAVGANGQPLTTPDGKTITVAPVLDAAGNPIYSNSGNVLTQQPQFGVDGKPLVSVDGKPILLAPMIGKDGKPIVDTTGTVITNKVLTDMSGRPVVTPARNPIFLFPVFDVAGNPVRDSSGEIIWQQPQLGNNGQPLIAKDGTAILLTPILGKDGKPVLDAQGKVMTNQAVIAPSGAPMVTPNGKPILISPILNDQGKPVIDAEGKPVMDIPIILSNGTPAVDAKGNPLLSTPLLGSDGKLLKTPAGNLIIASPILDAKGQPVKDANGIPLMTKPIAGKDGKILLNKDGTAVMVQPLIDSNGKQVTVTSGTPILVGAMGVPLFTAKGEPIVIAGQALLFGGNGKIFYADNRVVQTLGGRPLFMTAMGTPLSGFPGAPLTDRKGLLIQVSANGGVLDSSGNPILTPEGKDINISDTALIFIRQGGLTVSGPDGKKILMGLNGALTTSDGKPLVGPNNKPLFWDYKGAKIVDASGVPVKIDAKGNIVGDKVAPENLKSSPVSLGALGVAMLTPKGEPIVINGLALLYGSMGKMFYTNGSTVKTLGNLTLFMTQSGTPMTPPPGNAPLLDRAGLPIQVNATGGVLDSAGNPILAPNERAINVSDTTPIVIQQGGVNVITSGGQKVLMGLNGFLTDSQGKALVTLSGQGLLWDHQNARIIDAAGTPVKIDAKGNIDFS